MKQIFALFIFLLSIAPSLRADSQTRQHVPFRGISLRINANVYYEQGDSQKVEITAMPETMNKLITEVKDNKLIIRYSFEDRFIKNWDSGPVSIKVTTPEIESFAISGSGDIVSEKHFQTRFIELNISGSGNIKIASITCDQLKSIVTGSGNIVLSGDNNAMNFDVRINGSGNVRAEQFSADYADVWISGSGDCSLRVNKHIKARIIGSGDIRYKGNPSVESSISGSGHLRKMD